MNIGTFIEKVSTSNSLSKIGGKMKKLVLLAAIILFAVSSMNAQSKSTFELGANLSLPSGATADFWDLSMGFGATGYYTYNQDKSFVYGGTASVIYYSSDNLTLIVVPVQSFGKYYLADNIYGVGKFGYTVVSGSTSSGTLFTGNSGISFGGGAGIELGAIDVGASYDFYFSEFNSITAFVGFKF